MQFDEERAFVGEDLSSIASPDDADPHAHMQCRNYSYRGQVLSHSDAPTGPALLNARKTPSLRRCP